jgi:SAM-dependent methyltransferase
VLDLGCGSGALGAALKAVAPREVVGVTHSESEAAIARERLDEVRVANLETFAPVRSDRFDCIICSHVLEHLVNPGALLLGLLPSFTREGILVVALPNALHWRQRLAFVSGRFEYQEGGAMDRTHLRFYDWSTSRALIEQAGYQILDARADGTFPGSRFLPALGPALDRASRLLLPGLVGVQFLFVCRPAS